MPEAGLSAPDLEMIPVQEEPPRLFQVQKIITEVYVFTDLNNMQYGAKTFQDVVLMGEMTKDQVDTIIENKKKRKRRGS
jgi:hypothetical protein